MHQALRNARALIVDDDEALAAMLARQLAAEGFEVARARTTEQALAAAHDGYSVALVDLSLGGENGWSCVSKLREEDSERPIVVMTGCFLDADAVEEAALLGAAAVLQKPFLPQELLTTVRAVLH